MSPGVTAPIVLNRRAAVRETITGVERYADELSRELLALAPDSYVALAPRRGARGPALGQAWEQSVLPARAVRLGARLILSPANLAPLAWPGNVVVVHDAAVLREPDAYTRVYRAWHKTAGIAAARRARAVITVSEFSRSELVTLAGLDAGRIEVVPGGVDARFDPRPGPDDATAIAACGLAGPYVLCVATADRRKNLPALAPVAQALAEHGVTVAWAGDARPQFDEVPDPGHGVRALGWVPDAALPALYRGARAFVLPSRYEGFGLPCLEAMACGVPVVAADRGALPETCGDAALLADPDDPRAFAGAVLAAVHDGPVRERLRAAGPRRAAEFRWQRTAATTDALLRSL